MDILMNAANASNYNKYYTLMNKDRKLLDFTITSVSGYEMCKEIRRYENIPRWFTDIDSWVNNRSAARHRIRIAEFLRNHGADKPSGFIALTHCLSLTDTLWVKDSIEDVSWKNVSLYTNNFNEVISQLSFDGTGMFDSQISITSPELTTDGSYSKCWIGCGKDIELLKTGNCGEGKVGIEPYCEVVSSQIFDILCNNSVKYSLRVYHGSMASACSIFTTEDYGYIGYYAATSKSPGFLKLLEEYSELGCEDEFRRMIVADCVSLNSDRHYGNFGYLVNNDTFELVRLNPVFDFNLAMLPYVAYDDDFNSLRYIEDLIKKHRPVFGDDYVGPARVLLTPAIASDLKNLKYYDLEVATDETFTDVRLANLNVIKDIQIDLILGNRKQFAVS